MNPWLRPIPWYVKVKRVLHCMLLMGPFAYAKFLDYLNQDLKYLIKEIEK